MTIKSIKEIFTDCTLCYHSCCTIVTVEEGKAISVRGPEFHPLDKGKIVKKVLTFREEFGPTVLGVSSGSIGVENLEMAGLIHRFEAAFGSPDFYMPGAYYGLSGG
jgi:formate dehydrogenase (coenzyme F420) alpha subunit